MNKISIEELQKNFEDYLDQVNEGESFLVTSEHGEVILAQYRQEEVDDFTRIYTEHNEAP